MKPSRIKEKKQAAVNLLAKIAKCNQQTDPNGIQKEYNMSILNIVSFLRGPDSGAWRLKELTSCRIRAIIGMKEEIALPMIVRESRLSSNEMIERNSLLNNADKHFTQHWIWAKEAIKFLYNYDLETETSLDVEKPING